MIYEYALDPKVVATWGNKHDYRYFLEKFGLGQPRLVSRYPKKWQRLVWEAYDGQDDIEKTRITELLSRFSEKAISRSDSQYDGGDWLENVKKENVRKPFKAVILKENPEKIPNFLVADDIDETQQLWSASHSTVVPRTAKKMAQIVEPLLSAATEVIFVDPHFTPEMNRYQRTFQAFLVAATTNRKSELKSVAVHTQAKAPEVYFRNECHVELKKLIPKGVKVTFVRWVEKEGSESLHNRYILTNIGGVSFQHGLDKGKDGQTDIVAILDRESYLLRLSQYDRKSNTFDLAEEPFELIG